MSLGTAAAVTAIELRSEVYAALYAVPELKEKKILHHFFFSR